VNEAFSNIIPPSDTSKLARLPLRAIYKNRPHRPPPRPPPRSSSASLTFRPAQLPPPALTYRRPLDQLTQRVRVYFGHLASTSKMGSHDGVVSGLHRTRSQVNSKYNSKLTLPPPHLILSFFNFSCCPLSIAVICPLIRSYSNRILRCSSLLLILYPHYCYPCVYFFGLFSRADRSKKYRRGL
jgi:hypothetical protein